MHEWLTSRDAQLIRPRRSWRAGGRPVARHPEREDSRRVALDPGPSGLAAGAGGQRQSGHADPRVPSRRPEPLSNGGVVALRRVCALAQRRYVERRVHGADGGRDRGPPRGGRRASRPACPPGGTEPRRHDRPRPGRPPPRSDRDPRHARLADTQPAGGSPATVGSHRVRRRARDAGGPRLLRLELRTRELLHALAAEVEAPFPEAVRFIAVYSRTDEVVRWESCLDPAGEHVEVTSSHLGMGMDVEVWRRVASALAEAPHKG